MGRRHRKMTQKRLITKVILFYNGTSTNVDRCPTLVPMESVVFVRFTPESIGSLRHWCAERNVLVGECCYKTVQSHARLPQKPLLLSLPISNIRVLADRSERNSRAYLAVLTKVRAHG